MTTAAIKNKLTGNRMTKLLTEEKMNFLTHALGTLLSAAGCVILTVKSVFQGDPWKIVSFLFARVPNSALPLYTVPPMVTVPNSQLILFPELVPLATVINAGDPPIQV